MAGNPRFGAVLVWASRPGSAFQAAAVLGAAGAVAARVLGLLSNHAAIEAGVAMALVWVIGTRLARR